jgi:cyclopropane-fatty-acyl-phospholipid synthase
VRFELVDYRNVRQRFDRIVSVGMFEHVGILQFGTYFAKIRDCLTDDGIALVHSIGRSDGPGATNAWVEKYIFPGGYAPALSETLAAVEKTGLWVTDIEVLRLHYAKTIAMWRRRFAANRDVIASLYDQRFCRMFELYLAGSELAFRRQLQMNFQIQLTRKIDTLPIVRDYMFTEEHRPAAREEAAAQMLQQAR